MVFAHSNGTLSKIYGDHPVENIFSVNSLENNSEILFMVLLIFEFSNTDGMVTHLPKIVKFS